MLIFKGASGSLEMWQREARMVRNVRLGLQRDHRATNICLTDGLGMRQAYEFGHETRFARPNDDSSYACAMFSAIGYALVD